MGLLEETINKYWREIAPALFEAAEGQCLARLNEELLEENMPPNKILHNLSYPALVYFYKPVMTTIILSLLQQ